MSRFDETMRVGCYVWIGILVILAALVAWLIASVMGGAMHTTGAP